MQCSLSLDKFQSLATNEEIFYGNSKKAGEQHPKCDIHQRHIPQKAKEAAIKALGGPDALFSIPKNIADFESLYSIIKNQIGSIDGIGDLTIYDVAFRLGVINRILPKDYVYLHASPLISARHLHKVGKIVLPKKRTPCVSISVFSPCFPTYTAGEIEHYLCINKKSILKLTD